VFVLVLLVAVWLSQESNAKPKTHPHTSPQPTNQPTNQPNKPTNQDLDAGVIVGQDRTYGKGLVQNVEPLPFRTALKYTVAKYYTPSGACVCVCVLGGSGGGVEVGLVVCVCGGGLISRV
jgi:hypothetical protein